MRHNSHFGGHMPNNNFSHLPINSNAICRHCGTEHQCDCSQMCECGHKRAFCTCEGQPGMTQLEKSRLDGKSFKFVENNSQDDFLPIPNDDILLKDGCSIYSDGESLCPYCNNTIGMGTLCANCRQYIHNEMSDHHQPEMVSGCDTPFCNEDCRTCLRFYMKDGENYGYGANWRRGYIEVPYDSDSLFNNSSEVYDWERYDGYDWEQLSLEMIGKFDDDFDYGIDDAPYTAYLCHCGDWLGCNPFCSNCNFFNFKNNDYREFMMELYHFSPVDDFYFERKEAKSKRFHRHELNKLHGKKPPSSERLAFRKAYANASTTLEKQKLIYPGETLEKKKRRKSPFMRGIKKYDCGRWFQSKFNSREKVSYCSLCHQPEDSRECVKYCEHCKAKLENCLCKKNSCKSLLLFDWEEMERQWEEEAQQEAIKDWLDEDEDMFEAYDDYDYTDHQDYEGDLFCPYCLNNKCICYL